MADPTNVLTVDDVAMMTGRRVSVAVVSSEDLNLLLARLTRMEESIEDIVDEDHEAEAREPAECRRGSRSDAPIIKLVHSIVAQAVQQGASDIHVNPEEGDTRVLFRVDGVLLLPLPSSGGWRWEWCRGSRSWASWTSPRSACPRTAASRSPSRAGAWTFAW